MKVLSVNKFYYVKGGSDRYFFQLNTLLEKNGHKVIPFSMQSERNLPSPYSRFFVSNIEFFEKKKPVDYPKILVRVLYSLGAKRNIERLIEREKPDIAHLHIIAHQISPSVLHSLNKYNIPVIQTLHEYKRICPVYSLLSNGKICERCKPHRYYNVILHKCNRGLFFASFLNCVEMYMHKWLKIFENNINAFITPSFFLKQKLDEWGFKGKEIVYIPNFIDIENYTPNYSHQGYFIYFGRLDKAKGLHTLLQAMRKVKTNQLYIVGEGSERRELEQFIEQYRLDNVKLVGHQLDGQLKLIIRESMFAISPSECYENCPMAILESFAFGKPVIGSRIGGIPELVQDGKTGLTFEPGSAGDLEDKIEYLINHPHKIIEMGRNARTKVEREYNAQRHYRQIMKVYQRVLE